LQAQFIQSELEPSIDPSVEKRTHKYVNGLDPRIDPIQYGSIRVRFKPRSMDQRLDRNVDMEAYDAQSDKRLWSIRFDNDVPEIVAADGDRILLVMDRESESGTGEAGRNRSKLLRTSDEIHQLFKEQGTLVEVIANRTGAVEHAFVAPQLSSFRREERTAALFGNLLAVYGNSNNTAVYRVSDGSRLFAFFGRALAGDDGLGLVAATNRPQELTIYSVADGAARLNVKLDHNILAARYVPGQKKLLVLTATQHVYEVDLSALLPAQR
jgi:hypothetical protein